MVELILFGSLAVMIFINIPIAIGLGLASIATLIYVGSPLGVVPSMMQASYGAKICITYNTVIYFSWCYYG